jgi:hypothetical protein
MEKLLSPVAAWVTMQIISDGRVSALHSGVGAVTNAATKGRRTADQQWWREDTERRSRSATLEQRGPTVSRRSQSEADGIGLSPKMTVLTRVGSDFVSLLLSS